MDAKNNKDVKLQNEYIKRQRKDYYSFTFNETNEWTKYLKKSLKTQVENEPINGSHFFLTYGCCGQNKITKEKLLNQLILNSEEEKPKRKIVSYIISQENYKASRVLTNADEFHIHVYIAFNKNIVMSLDEVGRRFDYKNDENQICEGFYQAVFDDLAVINYVLKEDQNPLTDLIFSKQKKWIQKGNDFQKDFMRKSTNDLELSSDAFLVFNDYTNLLLTYKTVIFTEYISMEVFECLANYLKSQKMLVDIHSDNLQTRLNQISVHPKRACIIYQPSYSSDFKQKDFINFLQRSIINKENYPFMVIILNENTDIKDSIYNSKAFNEIKEFLETKKKQNINHVLICTNIKPFLKLTNKNENMQQIIYQDNSSVVYNSITNNTLENPKIDQLEKKINHLETKMNEQQKQLEILLDTIKSANLIL